ncbi:hypothetical protein MJG53_001218 [Ovis ammon polii x Ovis aries]|uniref:Uncharacterized protein n=1 Tax=Ovis ammon polii x Ovis aries TaxID=2918886 RepID=A0ACB9VKX5_9CETA|nr:hypothetical protein MJT46_000713 [Ovis ammon polii x Ovis aries]KAI4590169.1 hypothetical protein MJG53_001218 [Ovis ammon polii x Ovis aries]
MSYCFSSTVFPGCYWGSYGYPLGYSVGCGYGSTYSPVGYGFGYGYNGSGAFVWKPDVCAFYDLDSLQKVTREAKYCFSFLFSHELLISPKYLKN